MIKFSTALKRAVFYFPTDRPHRFDIRVVTSNNKRKEESYSKSIKQQSCIKELNYIALPDY